MGVLIRYELKKLLSRRLVLLAVALCAAYNLYAIWQPDSLTRSSGHVQGIKDVYRQYEGRVVTEAFKKEVQKASDQYASDHPGLYIVHERGDGSASYSAYSLSSASGVFYAYDIILNMLTVETWEAEFAKLKERLASGYSWDGSPLTEAQRKNLEAAVQKGYPVPVVHYAMGWIPSSSFSGYMVILLLVYGLLPLFSAEVSCRMDGVLLCSAGRRRAALAKMLAASVIACALTLLFLGMEFLIQALTYGLDGALLPMSALQLNGPGTPIAAAYAAGALATLLAAMACASLVALASALSRSRLLPLLLAGAFLASQVALQAVFDFNSRRFSMQDPVLIFSSYYAISEYDGLLPVGVLIGHATMIYQHSYAAFTLGFPALLTALLFWLAPRQFLRQRKA